MDLLKKFKAQRKQAALRRAREHYEAEHVRYAIRYQYRNPKGCVGPRWDYRSWRCYAALPILFHTCEEADEWLATMPDPFKNLRHLRKVSCSVERIVI